MVFPSAPGLLTADFDASFDDLRVEVVMLVSDSIFGAALVVRYAVRRAAWNAETFTDVLCPRVAHGHE